jgi:hypothetical protein
VALHGEQRANEEESAYAADGALHLLRVRK